MLFGFNTICGSPRSSMDTLNLKEISNNSNMFKMNSDDIARLTISLTLMNVMTRQINISRRRQDFIKVQMKEKFRSLLDNC